MDFFARVKYKFNYLVNELTCKVRNIDHDDALTKVSVIGNARDRISNDLDDIQNFDRDLIEFAAILSVRWGELKKRDLQNASRLESVIEAISFSLNKVSEIEGGVFSDQLKRLSNNFSALEERYNGLDKGMKLYLDQFQRQIGTDFYDQYIYLMATKIIIKSGESNFLNRSQKDTEWFVNKASIVHSAGYGGIPKNRLIPW